MTSEKNSKTPDTPLSFLIVSRSKNICRRTPYIHVKEDIGGQGKFMVLPILRYQSPIVILDVLQKVNYKKELTGLETLTFRVFYS